MDDATGEHELRVTAPGDPARIEAALRTLDAEARVRIDPATGIVHVTSARDTLEIVAALNAAGLETTAMTG